jgi:long-chain acyl-CoA synthetase
MRVTIADDGEILLQGPNLLRGYYRDKVATAAAIRDGWLHTGDLGRLDEDGFLYITGRKKELIITATGKNVAPVEIENALRQQRGIAQAVVCGDRRPYVSALIAVDAEAVPHAGEDTRALVQRAIDVVNARLSRAAQIKRFTLLPRELSQEAGELTPTLKLKRTVVIQRYADLIDRMYQRS